MEYMVPPIVMCVNGHKICNICRPRPADCPTCRQQFLDTRNVALEDLARQVMYPCKYGSYGCAEVFPNDVIIDHQNRCWYCPQSCPVTNLNTQKCSWTGNYDQIENHLKEKHRDKCYENDEEELRTLKGLHNVSFYFKFLFAFNEVFFQVFRRRGDKFYVSVYYVGHTDNAGKYKCRVEFVNTDNTEGVSVMHLARSFNKEIHYLTKSGKLLYDVLSHLTNKEGDLNYKTQILRVGV
jgi:hypothetical protein